jgi:type II secretory pathway pseudopilin PulG
MKTLPYRWKGLDQARTLVAVLVILLAIGFLAALLLPAVHSRPPPNLRRARVQAALIAQAIESYHSTYDSYPVSEQALQVAKAATDDFTFGGQALERVLGPGPWSRNNAEVVAILLDQEYDPRGNPTVNKEHARNPQKIIFLAAHMVAEPSQSGVGPDLVYRDPWGSPYIISLDLNGDGKCRDALYGRKTVSQLTGSGGSNGLVEAKDDGGQGFDYQFNGGVMVWSLGPDRKADANRPANVAPNADNILSWQQ